MLKPLIKRTFIFLGLFTNLISSGQNKLLIPEWQSFIRQRDNKRFDRIRETVEYNAELYILGTYYTEEAGTLMNVHQFCRWNGQRWDSVGSNEFTDRINSIAVYKDALYAAINSEDEHGQIENDFKAGYLAKWNGTKWDSVGGLVDENISDLISCKSYLFGVLFHDHDAMTELVRWNGTKWDTIGKVTLNYGEGEYKVYKDNLYFGGKFNAIDSLPLHSIARWDGVTWNQVGKTEIGDVTAMAIYDGELVVGEEGDIDGFHGIARWNGNKWDSLGHGLQEKKCNSDVFSMAEYNGELYITGLFDKAGVKPARDFAKWNGKELIPVKGPPAIFKLFNYKGELFANGDFDDKTYDKYDGIAKYSTSIPLKEKPIKAKQNKTNYTVKEKLPEKEAWIPADDSINDMSITSLIVYEGDLYAAGNTSYNKGTKKMKLDKNGCFADGFPYYAVSHIYKWNGKNWHIIATSDTGASKTFNNMCIYHDKLYVCGLFNKVNNTSVNSPVCWDGTNWTDTKFKAADGWIDGPMTVLKDRLYAASGASLWYWNDTVWRSLGKGFSYPATIKTLCTYNGALYVGGEFDTIDGKATRGIAKWNDSSWSSLGKGISSASIGMNRCEVDVLTVYKGELYIGGAFDHINGKRLNDIAKWDGKNFSLIGEDYYSYSTDMGVQVLCAYKDDLYITWDFNLYKWNGRKLTELAGEANCRALCEYNGQLYAAGRFSTYGKKSKEHCVVIINTNDVVK